MKIAVLRCSVCGMELHNDFQRGPFDFLTADQTEFLISFLRQRGNMSSLQTELGISYPTAKKKLDDLLTALKLLLRRLNNRRSNNFLFDAVSLAPCGAAAKHGIYYFGNGWPKQIVELLNCQSNSTTSYQEKHHTVVDKKAANR